MTHRVHASSLLSLVVFLLVLLATPSLAFAEVTTEPTLSEAQCAIVEDSTGKVLYEKNADQQMPMASITKIMTAMVALDSGIDLDTPCTITEVDLGEDSVMAGYTSSDTPTLRELLRVMLVYSANDAAEYIAINVAGSEDAFVELMNQKAAELGMTNTHFSNPHGLEEDDHYSSARDLALMGRVAILEYPFIAGTVHLSSVTGTVNGTETTFYSTDKLMSSYSGLRGIKTGSVASGTAFLGACQKEGVALFTCVLGCQTSSGRFSDTAALLDWAYDTYQQHRVANERTIVDVRPWAYNFSWCCVIHAESNVDIPVWPDDELLSYTSTRLKSYILVDNNQLVGTTTWSQGDRKAGEVRYVATLVPMTATSFNPFALPLFGRAA